MIEDTTDSLAAALLEKPQSSVQDAINSSASDVSKAILRDISASDIPTFEVETSFAQIKLAKIDAAEKDFYTRLESAKNLLREQNQNLINLLRRPIEMRDPLRTLRTDYATKFDDLPKAPRITRKPDTGLALDDLDGRVVEPEPRGSLREQEEQSRVDHAVKQLIAVAIGMNELAQNRLLKKIQIAISASTLSLQVSGLTEITHEYSGRVRDSPFREIEESLKPPEIRRAEAKRFTGRSFEPREVFRPRMPRR